jgi:hypothetical protein
MAFGELRIGFWETSAGVREASDGILGASAGIRGASDGILGASAGVREASDGILGAWDCVFRENYLFSNFSKEKKERRDGILPRCLRGETVAGWPGIWRE